MTHSSTSEEGNAAFDEFAHSELCWELLFTPLQDDTSEAMPEPSEGMDVSLGQWHVGRGDCSSDNCCSLNDWLSENDSEDDADDASSKENSPTEQ